MRTEVRLGRRGDITSRDDVAALVGRFYRDVAMDPVLGPLFVAAGIDWRVHIERLEAFWSRELLGEAGWTGNVVTAHGRVLDVAPFGADELARWLDLWRGAVAWSFAGPVADHAARRGEQIAAAVGALAARQAQHRGQRADGA